MATKITAKCIISTRLLTEIENAYKLSKIIILHRDMETVLKKDKNTLERVQKGQ